ncbi:MAG: DUF1659 domain-containing protein [Bacillota bacterium]
MPVINTPVSSGLKLMVQTGIDEKGNPVIRSRNFARVKPDASDEAVYNTAVVLGSLQEHPVAAVRRTAEVDLVFEG